jgi:Protein of unknown function (DUF4239)
MDFYWVYDLPNWQFFLLMTGSFVSFSLLGAFLFSNRFEKLLGLTQEHNGIVSTYLSLTGAFYGITLGLIAVGTFENFKDVSNTVTDESSALTALYRDVTILEKPEKVILQNTLKEYTHYVIEQAWPLQRQGLIPKGGTIIINKFQDQFSKYIPESEKDKLIFAEVFDQYNVLIEKRRNRLNAVNEGLPSTIYLILFLGAFINILLTWFLVIKNKKLDVAINILSGVLLGSLIFLIIVMDNPFRGQYSVGSDSFQLLLDGVMK